MKFINKEMRTKYSNSNLLIFNSIYVYVVSLLWSCMLNDFNAMVNDDASGIFVSSVIEETELSHLFLLSEDLLTVEVIVLSELCKLRSNEVGCSTTNNVVSVDGSCQLELGPLSVHFF